MIKQVIIVRKDLNMRRGKESAQVAHASMKVFFDRAGIVLNRYPQPNVDTLYYFELTSKMAQWMKGSFAKIVVWVNSEEELFELQKQAEEAGIVNAIILDNGHTEFKENCPNCEGQGEFELNTWENPVIRCEQCNGTGKVNKPTYTALAIGPDYSDKVDKITGHLKLR